MSSLLVWARRDNESRQQWQQFARGDVIDLHQEDDFHWGNSIIGPDALGWWRVVIVEGVPAAQLVGLVLGEPGERSPGAPYLIRTCCLDLDGLEAAEGKRLDHSDAIVIGYQQLLGAIRQKVALPDRSVIGHERTVIG